MSLSCMTGSHDSGLPAAATQSSGAFTVRHRARAEMTNSVQAYLAREQNGWARHEQQPQRGDGGLLRNGVAINGACIDRPRFPRFHASIAERQLDWGWQQCPDAALPSGENEPNEAEHAGEGFSTRALWLGGVAFALLAAGIISAVATVQSSRPLPFEIWAQGDLMQRAGGTPSAMARDAIAPGQLAGALTGRAGHDQIAELVEPVAALREPAATPASASADREPAEADAALALDVRLEPSDIEIAVLGPILASAAAAEKLAADLPLSRVSVPAAGVGTRARALAPLAAPAGFKSMLVSASQPEPDVAARPPSRP